LVGRIIPQECGDYTVTGAWFLVLCALLLVLMYRRS